ncbi:MAG TPA: pirin family protein [Cytophagaceae bacterium]|nr:pirin family protein [Cytophagaceae bacterium]
MKTKNVERIVHAQSFRMGEMIVKQPLPARGLNKTGPFILLHHAGPKEIKPGSKKFRIDPHPHRGFQPVTFIFQGEIEHYDSKGNHGLLGPGEVQWMNAGKGIVHSEGPPQSFFEKGGTSEIIQLWINLPKSQKMSEPSYQDLKREMIPVLEEQEGKLKFNVVAGKYKDVQGPAVTATPILAMTAYAEEDVETTISFPASYTASLYLLEGELILNGEQKLEKEHLAIFDSASDAITIKTTQRAKMLILAGEPINEPMVSHGPFVMNNVEEINQAIDDYENGKMGVLTK